MENSTRPCSQRVLDVEDGEIPAKLGDLVSIRCCHGVFFLKGYALEYWGQIDIYRLIDRLIDWLIDELMDI